MAKEEIIAALEIGSSRISCVIGRITPQNNIEILEGSQLQTKGIKNGIVIDIDESAYTIKKVIEQSEEKIDKFINSVYVGIRGQHIETIHNRGVITISRSDKEITPEDVVNVIEVSKAIHLANDREIIDTIPQEFSLDKQRGVHNPVGMEGNFLEVQSYIITASTLCLNNIDKAIAKEGFDVIEHIYSLLAVGNVVVTDEEKELGCLLIDIGGQLIGITIYAEGNIKFNAELAIGADYITRDISYALKTSINQAQYIKENYGIAFSSLVKDDHEIEFTGVDGRTIRKISIKYLADIISPRVEEIFEKINDLIQTTAYSDLFIPGGIILTGGGANLSGMKDACEKIFNVDTRIGLPYNITGKESIISNPSFATAIGLFKYKPNTETSRTKKFFKKGLIFKRIRDLFS